MWHLFLHLTKGTWGSNTLWRMVNTSQWRSNGETVYKVWCSVCLFCISLWGGGDDCCLTSMSSGTVCVWQAHQCWQVGASILQRSSLFINWTDSGALPIPETCKISALAIDSPSVLPQTATNHPSTSVIPLAPVLATFLNCSAASCGHGHWRSVYHWEDS